MSVVVITVDSADITDSVLFASASFEQSMNAVPGSFQFTVRDPDRVLSFSTGVEMSLDVDGVRMFGGYVTQVAMGSMASAADVDPVEDYQLRVWKLRGTDYNIIFDKRVLRDTSDYLGHIVVPISTDGAMVTTIVEDYTDCSDFTTTGIDSSAVIPGTGSDLLQQGIKLREPFQNYSFFGGTIWYIDGSKNFIYVPFEDVEKRWGFSDSPNHNAITVSPNEYQGATTGFRQVEGTEDGTFIQNDVLIWGGNQFAGAGGGTVFARVEDATSQSTYGRWQYAETHFGEKKYMVQEQVDARADVIVNGPPGADVYGQQKGLRYAQWQFTFTWFSADVPLLSGTPDHLVPGDIVTIDLTAFGVTQLLPLRSLRTSFPDGFENDGTHLVQFDGTFGLQLSDPFTLWRYLLSNQTRVTNQTITANAVNDDSTQTTYGAFGQFSPLPATDGVETVFHLELAGGTSIGYIPGSLVVYLNGLQQRPGTDYTESDSEAGEFTMATAPETVDDLYVTCLTLEGGSAFVIESAGAVGDADGEDAPGYTWYAIEWPPVPGSWAGDTFYPIGSTVIDSNGHTQVRYPNYPGLSDSVEPTWDTGGSYTSDGDGYWFDLGIDPDFDALAQTWAATTNFGSDDSVVFVQPTAEDGRHFIGTSSDPQLSGPTEPDWPTTAGDETVNLGYYNGWLITSQPYETGTVVVEGFTEGVDWDESDPSQGSLDWDAVVPDGQIIHVTYTLA